MADLIHVDDKNLLSTISTPPNHNVVDTVKILIYKGYNIPIEPGPVD